MEGKPVSTPSAVRWDDSRMKRSRADVCNVSASADEVVLSFGTLLPAAGADALPVVAIGDRLVLSPAVARELTAMLEQVVRDHEARFGPLPEPAPAR